MHSVQAQDRTDEGVRRPFQRGRLQPDAAFGDVFLKLSRNVTGFSRAQLSEPRPPLTSKPKLTRGTQLL